jgi:uncharacterized membrane protein
MLGGTAVATFLPWHPDMVTRLLIGWNIATWCYLGLMGWVMTHATSQQVRGIAEKEDEAALILLTVLSTAAFASLVAIVLELTTIKGLSAEVRVVHYLLTTATVLGSWFFMGTLFTFHYARMFYQDETGKPPLYFPEGKLDPDYWDFLYFSFTIAAASQTGDVNLMSPAIRKAALVQMVLSFFFNVSVLGLSINIAAGLIGG